METRIKFWILPLLILVFVYKIILLQPWNNVVHNQRDGSIDIKRILDIIYIMLNQFKKMKCYLSEIIHVFLQLYLQRYSLTIWNGNNYKKVTYFAEMVSWFLPYFWLECKNVVRQHLTEFLKSMKKFLMEYKKNITFLTMIFQVLQNTYINFQTVIWMIWLTINYRGWHGFNNTNKVS